jgi:hypothetical protein
VDSAGLTINGFRSLGSATIDGQVMAGWGGISIRQPLQLCGAASFGCGLWNIWDKTGGYVGMFIKEASSGGQGVFQQFLRDDNVTLGTIAGTVTGVVYNTTSDANLKDNIRPAREVFDSLAAIRALKVRHYGWKSHPDKRDVGLIAQEVDEHLPGVVSPPQKMVKLDDDGKPDGFAETPWMIDYSKTAPYMIDAMQVMADQIDALTAALTLALERIAMLERKVNQ